MAIAANTGLILQWCFVGLSLLLVAARLYVRLWLQCRANLSDLFIFVSYGLFVTVCALDTVMLARGVWGDKLDSRLTLHPSTQRYFPRLLHDTLTLDYTSVYCVKAALVFYFYYLLPGEMLKLRRALDMLAVFTACGWVAIIFLNTVGCSRVPANIDRNHDNVTIAQCRNSGIFYATLILHISSDVGLLLLPLLFLRVLQLSRRKQLFVALVMSFGILSIICAIGRAITSIKSISLPPVGVWSAAEITAAIAVACFPCVKWVAKSFRHYYNTKREAKAEREEWGTFGWSKKTGIGSGNWIQELEESDKEDDEDGVRMAAFFVKHGGKGDEETGGRGEGPSGMAGVRVSREIEQKSEHEGEGKNGGIGP